MIIKPSQLSQLVVHIIGAGYVGLVVACCLANSGHQLICMETAKAELCLPNGGRSKDNCQGDYALYPDKIEI